MMNARFHMLLNDEGVFLNFLYFLLYRLSRLNFQPRGNIHRSYRRLQELPAFTSLSCEIRNQREFSTQGIW